MEKIAGSFTNAPSAQCGKPFFSNTLASFKKNVTHQAWRALFQFGEYLFQSTRHFGECLKKMVSHTGYLFEIL
jgi:hypothetical protein